MTDGGHNGREVGMADVLDYFKMTLKVFKDHKHKNTNQTPYRALALSAEIIIHSVLMERYL